MAGGGTQLPRGLAGSVTENPLFNDGSMVVAAGANGRATIWTADGAVVRVVRHGAPIQSASFSPDDTRVVTATSKGVQFLDAATGKPLAPMFDHFGVEHASFSPDGTRVVAAGSTITPPAMTCVA